jgi:MAF protein
MSRYAPSDFSQKQPLVLASTSIYRKELLSRFRIDFITASPNIDETPMAGEAIHSLVQRLAEQKARTVATQHGGALVIGSDQAVVCEREILGKPMNHENACLQLAKLSGKSVTFFTSLCLLNSQTQHCQIDVVPFQVHFRELTAAMIAKYVSADKPYNCAGSFKSEGLGIVLFRALEGEDPTALIGLPLIRLSQMLANEHRPVL